MKKILLLCLLAISFSFHVNGQLTGITPSTAVHGQTLTTTITGNGIFIQSFSPSGNLYDIRLIQGIYEIPIFDYFNSWNNTTEVVHPDTVNTDVFSIPIAAPDGLYDLRVITGDVQNPLFNQTSYTLPDAFTILPPDGYISGVVFEDYNKDGVKDPGEPGIQGRQVKLMPINYTALTNINGEYSFPAPNGNYDMILLNGTNPYMFVTSLNDTLPVTVNNANVTGVDFGLKHSLYAITPNTCFQGVTSTHQINSEEAIFTTGANPWGNVSSVYVVSSPAFFVPNANVTVIDSISILIDMPVPLNTQIGSNIDVRVQVNSGYIGYHYLKSQLSVAAPLSFISGNVFFDQNQNKIKDIGEPGINGMKLSLSPDNSLGFTNSNGDYTLGSLGGIQVITPANNIPGLVLFTDSTTYTVNAQSSVSGNDFGYISSNPDYSIIVKDLDIFPRCFTNQYATFKVRNTSNTTFDANVWLKYDPLMTYVSSPITPTSVSNDTIYWNIPNISPYSDVEVKALLTLPGPNTSVTLIAGGTSLNTGGLPQLSAQDSLTKIVLCSYDPNDKAVEPPGVFAEHFTLMGDTLNYRIRFQNTGNDTAFQVMIVDTLDQQLNFNTFEVMGSSHSMITELYSSGEVKFTFNDILLPDSNINEPLSHGYVDYRIVGDAALADSTEIFNTAYIFFDFNPAVVTNTTLNTFVFVIPVGLNDPASSKQNVIVYPNPFSQSAVLKFENESGDEFKLRIVTITGQTALPELKTSGDHMIIEKQTLSTGIYFYILTNTQSGAVYSGKLIVK